MSLAVAFLEEYFERGEITKGAFALAGGIAPSNISKILSGENRISGLNLGNLLNGIPLEHDKLSFIAAYLRDQIPTEHAHQLRIELGTGTEASGVREALPADALGALYEQSLLSVATLLPAQTREQLYHLAKALRRDEQLQEVFRAIMRYVPRDQPRVGHKPIPASPSRTVAQEEQAAIGRELAGAQRSKDRAPPAPKPVAAPKSAARASGPVAAPKSAARASGPV